MQNEKIDHRMYHLTAKTVILQEHRPLNANDPFCLHDMASLHQKFGSKARIPLQIHRSTLDRIFLRVANSHSRCANPLFLQIFCRKLHENERIWTRRGRTSVAPPLDPPMQGDYQNE